MQRRVRRACERGDRVGGDESARATLQGWQRRRCQVHPFAWAASVFVAWVAMALAISMAFAGSTAFAEGRDEDTVNRLGLDVSYRLVVHQPFSPFSDTVYEVKRRGSTALVSLSRGHARGFGRLTMVSLISDAEFAEIVESLAACDDDQWEEGDAGPWLGVETRRTIVATGAHGTMHRVVGPTSQRDASCAASLQGAVMLRIVPEAYQVPFWVDGTYGLLRTTTDVPASLYVDSRPTGLVTPIDGLQLEPGLRTLRWVSVTGGIVREESVVIDAGRTTVLNVRLE